MKLGKILTVLILTLTAAMLFCSCGDKPDNQEIIGDADPSEYIIINDRVFFLPCTAQDFKNAGYTYEIKANKLGEKLWAFIYSKGIEIGYLDVIEGDIDANRYADGITLNGDLCSYEYMGLNKKTTREEARELFGDPVRGVSSTDVFDTENSRIILSYGGLNGISKRNYLTVAVGDFSDSDSGEDTEE